MAVVKGPDGIIEPGDIALTYTYDDDPIAVLYDFRATWDGGTTITWWSDINDRQPGLSPASSSPMDGWASWGNSEGLLYAYTWPDFAEDGWGFVPGGAPTTGNDDAEEVLELLETWEALAKTILKAIDTIGSGNQAGSNIQGGRFR